MKEYNCGQGVSAYLGIIDGTVIDFIGFYDRLKCLFLKKNFSLTGAHSELKAAAGQMRYTQKKEYTQKKLKK